MQNILLSFFIFHFSFFIPNDPCVPGASHDTTVFIGNIPVDFRFPDHPNGSAILVFPGWNFSRTDICNKSDFCYKARKLGYILVLPEMLKSVYASELFPETRNDWKQYPTLHWITDTLIPFCINQFKIFNSGGKNFLYGISTGARGVALVAENTGTLFLAGAALSGDYDQTKMPADHLMTGYYGPYSQFKDRWESTDNPSQNSDHLKIPLYLAHGKKDNIVPCRQSIDFFQKINSEQPLMGHQFNLCDTCGHNYAFWDAQTEKVITFFKKFGKNK